MSMIGLTSLCVLLLGAVFAPQITSHNPNRVNLTEQTRLKPPSRSHWFGTDHLGRDVFARSLYGARVSLLVGFVATVLAMGIGTTVGSLAGFYGGILDNLAMRFIDLLMSLPILYVIVILQSLLTKPSIFNVMAVIGATTWMGSARIVRGQILREREVDYVVAAHSVGTPPARIMLRHLLPNIIGPVIVAATLRVGRAIITEAALSYLGFGVQPPHASWGSMLNEGRGYLKTGPWIAIFPGLLLSLTVLSFNFIGDGLVSALNPYERK